MKVGDKVKVLSAYFGWAEVKEGDIGEITAVGSNKIEIYFPQHNRYNWNAKPEDLELIDNDHYEIY